VPLSEEEMRLLQQMERALAAEDPKFASALRSPLGPGSRAKFTTAIVGFLAGLAALIAGAVMQQTWLGVLGFVVMAGAATVALTMFGARVVERSQHVAATHDESEPHPFEHRWGDDD